MSVNMTDERSESASDCAHRLLGPLRQELEDMCPFMEDSGYQRISAAINTMHAKLLAELASRGGASVDADGRVKEVVTYRAHSGRRETRRG